MTRPCTKIDRCILCSLHYISVSCNTDEHKVITYLKYRGIANKGIYVCPCDPNLRTCFNYICTDNAVGPTYDLLILTSSDQGILRSKCYLIEVKTFSSKHWINAHPQQILNDVERKFEKGFDCARFCDVCDNSKKVKVLVTDINITNKYINIELKKRRIELITFERIVEFILTN